ncbi:unnamed protein product, partial [Prorocentrum cordatum]
HGTRAEVLEPAPKASRRSTTEDQQVPSNLSDSRPPPLSKTATTLAGSCAGTATTQWIDPALGRSETPTTAPPLSRRPSARSSSWQTSRPSSGLGSRPPSGGAPGSRSAHSRARADMLQRTAEVLRDAPASPPLAAVTAGGTAPLAAAAS